MLPSLGGLVDAAVSIDSSEPAGSGGDGLQDILGTFTVTNTNDSGAGSLRQAITDANASPGLDTITFSIGGSGPHTITLSSSLPSITDPVIIDGESEPDFAGTPVVVLDGNFISGSPDGLRLAAGSDGGTIRGLVIQRFGGDGIEIDGSDGNTITGNYIGTDVTGMIDQGNDQDGINIENASGNIVGGTNPGEGNVISGNGDEGIEIDGSTASGNQVLGNLIGVAANGTTRIGNGEGMWIEDAPGTIVGGAAVGAGNVIGANNSGIIISGTNATGTVVQGNHIGTDVSGAADVGGAFYGILFHFTDSTPLFPIGIPSNSTIGGVNAGEANTIANWGADGVNVGYGDRHAVLGNVIRDNGDLGIDLTFDDGVTINDVDDVDTGANDLQNHPVLLSAGIVGSSLVVTGTLDSTPSTAFDFDFFANTTADASGRGEAERYIGSFYGISTDTNGNLIFSDTLGGANVAAGEFVTATATDQNGNTSEFAVNVTAGSTIALIAEADTFLDAGATGTNYGVSTSLVVDRSGGDLGNQRVLLRFDESLIPGGTTILSADLKLNATQNNGAFDLNVYEVTRAWDEGSADGAAGEANWNKRVVGTNWTTSGGDVDGTVLATLNTGATGIHTWDVISLFQSWHADAKANNGLMIASPNTGTTTIVYDSREGSIPPVLEVSYLVVNSVLIADAGGDYNIVEGGTLALDASASDDPEGDPLTYTWDLDDDGSFDDATGVKPSVAWEDLPSAIADDGTYTIRVRADDGNGNTDDASATLTITNVAPVLAATGSATAGVGQSYTLNLSADDPGNDTISGWTINWGDGAIDTIAGNPSSATHTYTQIGFTRNITVSAVDEDGTWTESDLIVGHYVSGSDDVYRFDGTTGDFESIFESTSGAMSRPYTLVFGPDGNVYVTGYSSNNIVRFDAAGNYLGVFSSGSGLNGPDGLAFGPDGNLYVANYSSDSILRFDGTTGAFIDNFGSGSALNGPAGMDWGPDGDLYVSSWDNGRIVKFDGNSGGAPTTVISGLSFPEQIAFHDGDLYIANGAANDIKKWDGVLLTTYFSDATLDGATGLTFGPDGWLYVSSYDDDRIVRFDGTTDNVFVDVGSGGLDRPE